jgi:16S rRNA (uracil1498-N3)-methyltransferase
VSPPSSQSSNWATSSTSTSVSSLFSGRRSRSSGRSSLIPSTATRAASSGSSASSSSSIENLAAASPKRPPRFYVEPEQLSSSPSSSLSGSVVLLPATEARHARKVLRLRPGAPLELCDGRGRVAKAVLLEQESKNDPASVRIEGEVAALTVPLPRLTLAVAALGLKGGRGDWLVEKAAELGAASLVRRERGEEEMEEEEEEKRPEKVKSKLTRKAFLSLSPSP